MKKIIFLVALSFLFWPGEKVLAKIQLVNTEIDNTAVFESVSVELLLQGNLAGRRFVELKDGYETGTKQVGVYPSKLDTEYRLSVEGSWQYKVLEDSNASWQDLSDQIFLEKILLRVKDDSNDSDNTHAIMNTDDFTVYKDGKFKVYLPEDKVIMKKVFASPKNNNLHLLTAFYQVDSQVKDFKVELSYKEESSTSKSLYYYQDKTWHIIKSYNDFPEKIVSADIIDQDGPITLAIFEDFTAKDGIASYYDQSWYKNFGYANGDFAASRDYPKGTKLKVSRLLSGESIIVEVNDYGPELSTGRIIDLDIEAFKKLGSLRAGLIHVRVEPYDQN